jgi:hypothetical protein
MQRTMKYNALSYGIAVAIEASRRVYAAAARALREFEHEADVQAAEFEAHGPTIAEMIEDGTLPPPVEPSRELSAECSADEVAEPAKRKRVRVRTKPLTAADIVVGAAYVPKRGNNRTPNLTVVDVDYAEAKEFGPLVVYQRAGDEDIDSANMADFLALVARRADV